MGAFTMSWGNFYLVIWHIYNFQGDIYHVHRYFYHVMKGIFHIHIIVYNILAYLCACVLSAC
jgi:hypothetical protein